MNQVLGPLLVVIGIGLLGWFRLRLPSLELGRGHRTRASPAAACWAPAALGALFALSFCPVSAGLFFGGLVPLAIQANSRVLLPAVYGLGTGLPVLVCAVLLSLGVQWVGRAFHVLTRIERLARPGHRNHVHSRRDLSVAAASLRRPVVSRERAGARHVSKGTRLARAGSGGCLRRNGRPTRPGATRRPESPYPPGREDGSAA